MTTRTFLATLATVLLVIATGLPVAALAQGKSTLDAVKERGTLRIGVAVAEPWYFKDPSNEQWRGVGVSVGKALADSLGVRLEIVEIAWPDVIRAITEDRIDLMSVMEATPERQKVVDFPKTPLLYYALAVLVKDNNPAAEAKTWADLNRKDLTIAVPQGSIADKHVTKVLPDATIQRVQSGMYAIAAFVRLRADVACMFFPSMAILTQRVRVGRFVVPTPAYEVASSIAIRKEPDGRFRDWLDLEVARYYESNRTQGWYEEFLRSRRINPDRSPAIRRELWPKS